MGVRVVQTIWFLILVPLSLYLLSSYIKPLNGVRNLLALVTGILGLVYTTLFVHTTYSVVFTSFPYPGTLFRVARGILGGMFVTMLFSMGFRQGAKIMLIIAGILFVATPLVVVFALHQFGHAATQQPFIKSLNLYSLEALPLGLAIPAIVLIRQSRRSIGKSGQPDNGLVSPKDAGEDEMGA